MKKDSFQIPKEVEEYMKAMNEQRKIRVLEEMQRYADYYNISLQEVMNEINEEDRLLALEPPKTGKGILQQIEDGDI